MTSSEEAKKAFREWQKENWVYFSGTESDGRTIWWAAWSAATERSARIAQECLAEDDCGYDHSVGIDKAIRGDK